MNRNNSIFGNLSLSYYIGYLKKIFLNIKMKKKGKSYSFFFNLLYKVGEYLYSNKWTCFNEHSLESPFPYSIELKNNFN